jgi:chromosome segregation ATPase
VGSTSNVHDLESKVIELRAAAVAAKEEHQTNSASQMAALTEERDAVTAHLSIVQLENQELKSNILRLEWMLKECDSTLNGARQAHAGAVFRAEEAERQLADCLRCLSEEQQKHRFVLDERAELDLKLTKAEEKLVELTSLQITNSKLSMELERAQSWIQPTKKEREAELPEWKATEPRLQERISSLEASDNKKSRLLNGISQLIENKDRLLSDESANQLMQVPTAMVDDETKRARQFLQRYDDPRTFFTVGNRIPDNVGLNFKT